MLLALHWRKKEERRGGSNSRMRTKRFKKKTGRQRGRERGRVFKDHFLFFNQVVKERLLQAKRSDQLPKDDTT